MLCPTCGKESHNLRVCAFCQTPYPTDEPASARSSRATRAVAPSHATATHPAGRTSGDPRNAMEHRSRVKRWAAIGILAAFTAGYFFFVRERPIPVGVVFPNVIAAAMSPVEATNILKNINGSARVEERAGELTVEVAAAIFPERREGQLALAQQYARADEMVQGRKRPIRFLEPGGSQFAKADPEKGVSLTR